MNESFLNLILHKYSNRYLYFKGENYLGGIYLIYNLRHKEVRKRAINMGLIRKGVLKSFTSEYP